MTLPGQFNFDADGNLKIAVVASTNVVEATATADGTGTGTVPIGAGLVQITSADAAHIIVLPPTAAGRALALRNGAVGYELRSADPENEAINGGVGVAAESAIGANVLVECLADTDATWICRNTSTAGVISATQVAAP